MDLRKAKEVCIYIVTVRFSNPMLRRIKKKIFQSFD